MQQQLLQLIDIPVEIRDLLAGLQPDQWTDFFNNLDPNTLGNNHVFDRGTIDRLQQLVGQVPDSVVTKLQEFEGVETLGELPQEVAEEVLKNPAVVNHLPAPVVRGFSGGTAGDGVFHVHVASYALFSQDPELPEPLQKWEPREYHYVTETTEIERYKEYGPLNMPDYFGGGGGTGGDGGATGGGLEDAAIDQATADIEFPDV
jgi:hypothetical protein